MKKRVNWESVSWTKIGGAAALLLSAGSALAQPTITALGGGVPTAVTNSQGGTIYIGGSGFGSGGSSRWTLTGATLTGTALGGGGGGAMSQDGLYVTGSLLNTGPQIFGFATSGTVTPAYNPTPTLIQSTTLPAATEFAGARWSVGGSSWLRTTAIPQNSSLLVYGSSSSGSSSGGTFTNPNAISSDGRYMVGLAYVCTYNNTGTSVSANSFRWRPFVWDAQGNAGAGSIKVLPTPHKTTAGQTALYRTGNAYKVSTDGTVIVGAQEHNVGGSPAVDADSGRLVVWRWNASTSQYDMTFLDQGFNASGFPFNASSTPSAVDMNDAGTIIVGRAYVTPTGEPYVAKWVWDAGTQSWGAPINLGLNLATQASWLPVAVTSCAANQPVAQPIIGEIICVNADGSVVAGSARYSTCGSFMAGGFIWTQASNILTDWYDYQNALGTPGVAPLGIYGPIGDGGDITKGLPALYCPFDVSPDGNNFVGARAGQQIIPTAQPWIIQMTGGPGCVAPTITANPTASNVVNACTSSVILNVTASGTQPFGYQWYKDGVAMNDGTNPSGSVVTGATTSQLRIGAPLTSSDVGTYYAIVSGECGSPVQCANATISLDPAFPPVSNDVCSGATTVAMGTNVLGASGATVCGAFINDPILGSSCNASTKVDRWYDFTPASTGNYRFETCGANIDTVLNVYDGCNGAEVACNDNYATGPITGCTASRSRIASVALTGGVTYKVRIASPLGDVPERDQRPQPLHQHRAPCRSE